MTVKDLVGYQLIDLTDRHIVIGKDNKQYKIEIIDNYGGCCGYNEITTNFKIEKCSKENPIITRVDFKTDGSSCEISFYGQHKQIGILSAESSSGSGWCYGANVTLKCKELHLKEVISQW